MGDRTKMRRVDTVPVIAEMMEVMICGDHPNEVFIDDSVRHPFVPQAPITTVVDRSMPEPVSVYNLHSISVCVHLPFVTCY